MPCLRVALSLLFVSAFVVAAPVPKPPVKEFGNFGTMVGTKGVIRFPTISFRFRRTGTGRCSGFSPG